jgi:hypothetical protein
MGDGVHEGCECRRGVTQPKWHRHEFIRAIHGPHYCLFHIFIHYANLIVP